MEWFTDNVTSSSWTYPLVFLVAMLDAFFPLVPSETMVIAAGVLAANGSLELSILIVAAAAGAIVGDNISYVLGRTVGPRIRPRLFGGKRERYLVRAERALDERGPYLIVVSRFIPGGRTATTFAAGLLHMRYPRFLAFDILAGIVWALYASLIGYFGGKAFEDEPLKGILLALGIAFGIAVSIEGFRYWRKRSRADAGRVADDGLDRS